MTVPGPKPRQKTPVPPVDRAERFLDAGGHENTRDPGQSGGAIDKKALRLAQELGIDLLCTRFQHGSGRKSFPLACAEEMVRHGLEPDVDVKAGLMRGMPAKHRAAPRLPHVADQEAGKAVLCDRLRQILDISDKLDAPPAPIARQPHGLPTRPIGRQLHRTADTAPGITADHPFTTRGWRMRDTEKFTCRPGMGRNGQHQQGEHACTKNTKDHHHPAAVARNARTRCPHGRGRMARDWRYQSLRPPLSGRVG